MMTSYGPELREKTSAAALTLIEAVASLWKVLVSTSSHQYAKAVVHWLQFIQGRLLLHEVKRGIRKRFKINMYNTVACREFVLCARTFG